MFLRKTHLCRLLVFLGFLLQAGRAFAMDLLQPIGSCTVSDTDPFFSYMNCFYPWVMGMAAGMCVIWGVWGGAGMILSGGDQAKYSAGINQVVAAVVGLLLLLFASVILQNINPIFFKPGT